MADTYSPCQEQAEGIIKLSGEIGVHHLDDLYECLKDRFVLEQDLTIDCQEVVQMDTAAIQVLIAFKKSLAKGHKLTIKNISPALEKVWEIIGVKQIFLKE